MITAKIMLIFVSVLDEDPSQFHPTARGAYCSRALSVLQAHVAPTRSSPSGRSGAMPFPIIYHLCSTSFSYAQVCIIYAYMSIYNSPRKIINCVVQTAWDLIKRGGARQNRTCHSLHTFESCPEHGAEMVVIFYSSQAARAPSSVASMILRRRGLRASPITVWGISRPSRTPFRPSRAFSPMAITT